MIGRIYVGKHYMLLYILNIFGFREDFLSFSHNKSMGAIDPQSVASFDPRDLMGRICVRDHKTLQHTKYISCGPHSFSEDFPIVYWELCCHHPWQAVPNPISPKTLTTAFPPIT